MKITDTLGRILDVAIVVKAAMVDGWMEPLGYKLDNKSTTFLRVPNGPFALRVISKLGTEIRVHLDGKLLLATTVTQGIQYVERDSEGKSFYFGAAGEKSKERSLDPESFDDKAVGLAAAGKTKDNLLDREALVATASQSGTASDTNALACPVAPSGHGMLFVSARFADEPTQSNERPLPQELEFAFQMRAPADHDRSLSGSLSKLVEPPLPEEPDGIVKLETSSRPTFVCTCTGNSR